MPFLCAPDKDEQLLVKNYQGPLACQILEKNKGVCQAAIRQNKCVILRDVHAFPGHIACDSRSSSEIVVPLRDRKGEVYGVLDVDSRDKGAFDEVDDQWLSQILTLL